MFGNRKWTRRTSARTTRARTPYRAVKSRRSLLEGGNYFAQFDLALGYSETGESASTFASPILDNGYWQDNQWVDALSVYMPEIPDGLQPIHFAGGLFDIEVEMGGPDSSFVPPTGTGLYRLPFFIAIAMLPQLDTVGDGDPADVAPTIVPNYFLRDYGRFDQTPEVADYPESPWRRPTRTLWRRFGTLPNSFSHLAGYVENDPDYVLRGPDCLRRFSSRVRSATMMRNQGLYWVFGCQNATGVQTKVVTLTIGAHFGYRRAKQR